MNASSCLAALNSAAAFSAAAPVKTVLLSG
jgi:hypothetical protein